MPQKKSMRAQMTWLGFPVLVIGTTDKKGQFHPFGIGVTTNEKCADSEFIFKAIMKGVTKVFGPDYKFDPTISMADSASAITNGFMSAFGYDHPCKFTRLNCLSHTRRNLEKKMNCVKNKEIRCQLWQDIDHNNKM
jgi:hypothetical protein